MKWIVYVLLSLGSATIASTAPENKASHIDVIHEDSTDPSYQIGKLLRCPVCQGMPIADSPADMAQAMMKKVRKLQAQGKSEPEILKFFTDRYGDWVLLRPKAEGMNWFIWVFPPIAIFASLIWVFRRSKPSPVETDEKTDTNLSATSDDDPYIKAVRHLVDEG